MDFTAFNPLADPDFCFYDDTLLESVKVGDDHAHEFFRLLSLCHTVMSEEKSEGEREEGVGGVGLEDRKDLTVHCWFYVLSLARRAGLQGSVSR